MNKLIVIALEGTRNVNGSITEYLQEYFDDGWRIRQIACMAAGAGAAYGYTSSTTQLRDDIEAHVAGWIAVTLDRD